MGAKLVSIMGPPAVGKTTLAEALAAGLPAEIIYEDYAGNPFLADSYLGRAEARLPAQLYYLMSRVGQLSILAWPEQGIRVTDYCFRHDRIYAAIQLTEAEMGLYNRLAQRLEGLVKPPDLVILLDADEDRLLARIARRGRPFEKTLTAEFIASIRRACREAAGDIGCPVVTVDCARIDFRKPAERQGLLNEVRKEL